MIVSFNFSLYPREELRRLPVHIVPIMDGLVEAGHRVERFAVGLKPAPAVNVLPWHPATTAAMDDLIAARAGGGGRLRVGLLCLELQEGVPPERLRQAVDFVWSVPALAGMGGARIRYGYSSRAPGPVGLPRDIDVALRGAATPRRQAIVDQLGQRGFACFWIDNPDLPPYVTDDILERSKIALDLRPEAGRWGGAAAFTAQALHSAATVVSEAGGPDDLAAFTVPTPSGQLVERCAQILNSGMHAGLGLAALQKFRAETSMRAIMEEALKAVSG